jgi:CBS domain-containing protein
MIAKDLVRDSIIPLHTNDTALQANSLMEEFKVSHLPIVDGDRFLGLISDEELFNIDNLEGPIGCRKSKHVKPFVYESQHIYDVIKIVAAHKLSLIPVLDSKENYSGSITAVDLIHQFAHLTSADQAGSIIVLELNVHDYVVSQIGGIVEENGARILSLYVKHQPDSTAIEVVIKVNRKDIQGIIQTFERYQYNVKAYFNDSPSNDLYDRYDSLMKYLNI